MSLPEKLKPVVKILRLVSIYGSATGFVAYHVVSAYKSLNRIVNPNVLQMEKKHTPEYIYIDDPSYSLTLQMEQDKELQRSSGLVRIWKSLRHSLAWRLLWLCRHGSKEQRNVALQQLASFNNNKHWDCLKLAQALDKQTAVLLARTRGADQRYFLPPPIHVRRAALVPTLLSFRFKDMISAVQKLNPHSCIQLFLHKHFINIQEHMMEVDNIHSNPPNTGERDLCLLCLDALHHHVTLFHKHHLSDDTSANLLMEMGLMPTLAELMLRYKYDPEIDFAVLKILTVLSVHCELLNDFFLNGMIGELTRLLQNSDVRLNSSAAVCLANLSGEVCYRPGLYLLHPLYRTTTAPTCDTLLVHGLRGGVFVTWRQRDRHCPSGNKNATHIDSDDDTIEHSAYLDPDLKQVMEDLKQLKEETFLSEYDIVVHDIPIKAKREPSHDHDYITSTNKNNALIQEQQDKSSYTYCWPKDWLPQDCNNLRILGVNYWSSLSEWIERCPLQSADIASRALDLAPDLIDAGVGKKGIPIVWLAHSMGGLIVKQVLVEANRSVDYSWNSLCDNTKALLFYSTPHKGSALATMPRAAAAVLWPSSEVRQLQVNSPVLLDLHNNFVQLADKYHWETISFVESLPTPVTAFKVPVRMVEAHSADLGRGELYELPLDHLNICKPATRQSILYRSAMYVIKRLTTKEIDLDLKHNSLVQWLVSVFWFLFDRSAKDIDSKDEALIQVEG